MTERTPVWLQAGTYTAETDRALVASVFSMGGGVVRSTDCAVTQNGTPNMSVNVAPGFVVVPGTENSLQGSYLCWIDATKNVTIAAANATNPRIDLIVARVRDAAYSGASNTFAVEAVTGTAAASPAAPATPANSIVLAHVSVAAADTTIVTGDITDKRVPSGSCFPTITSTSLYPASTEGFGVYRSTNDANEGVEFYSGTAWRKPWNLPWGAVAAASNTSGTNQTGITAEADVTSMSVTWTAVSNRRYKISYSLGYANDTADVSTTIKVTDGSNVAKHATRNRVSIGGGNGDHLSTFYFETGLSGSVTRKIRALATSGISQIRFADTDGYMLVEDVGPTGAPA